MSAKYKIEDAKKNKNLINDEIKLSRIKSKGGQTKKSRAKAPAWFVEFRDEQREFNTRIEKDIANLKNDVSSLKKTQDQQNKHLQRIDSRLDRQDERFENIEHELSI